MQDETYAITEASQTDAGSCHRLIQAIAGRVEAVFALLNTTILVAMTGVVFVSVIARYGLNDALSWSEEFAIWGFTWMIFVGAALGVRGDRHMAVDLVGAITPRRLAPYTRFLRDLLIAFVLVELLVDGSILADAIGGRSTALDWPNGLRYAAIPISGAVGLFFLVTRLHEGRGEIVRNAAGVALAFGLWLLSTHFLAERFEEASPSLLMTVAFFVALGLGVPVAFAMLFGIFLTTWTGALLPGPAIVQNMVAGSTKFILLAIPFFLTSGYLLSIGGLSSRLIDFAAALVGHFRGGLAQVNVVNSVLIGGISGSSGADAASTSKILVPEMIKRGYSPEFSCAVTAAGSILPNIIPPAIAMLVYASVTNVSIARLFTAGIVPGLIIAAALMVTAYLISVKRNYEGATTRAPLSRVLATFRAAIPALMIAVLILGCIRLGITTATEAGVVALIWALVLGKWVYRAYGWRDLYRALIDCSVDAALIGFLIGASVPFAWVLIAEGVPQQLVTLAQIGSDNRVALFLGLNLILFLAGMFLDLTPAMLIIAPLFLPIMTGAGVDPVHLGIVMIVNLQLGGVTPPVGILVFIAAQITRVEPAKVFREVVPFFFAVAFTLLLLCSFPILSLGLWNLLE